MRNRPAEAISEAVKRARHMTALLQNFARSSDLDLATLLLEVDRKIDDWTEIRGKILEEQHSRELRRGSSCEGGDE